MAPGDGFSKRHLPGRRMTAPGLSQPQPSGRPSRLWGRLRGLVRAFPSSVTATHCLDTCHFQGQPMLLSGV